MINSAFPTALPQSAATKESKMKNSVLQLYCSHFKCSLVTCVWWVMSWIVQRENVCTLRKFYWAVLIKNCTVTLTLHFNRIPLAACGEWIQGPKEAGDEGGDDSSSPGKRKWRVSPG